jgi:acyl-ACP thioesterase
VADCGRHRHRHRRHLLDSSIDTLERQMMATLFSLSLFAHIFNSFYQKEEIDVVH